MLKLEVDHVVKHTIPKPAVTRTCLGDWSKFVLDNSCPWCGKCFAEKAIAKAHVRTQQAVDTCSTRPTWIPHERKQLREYCCPMCAIVCVSGSSCDEHVLCIFRGQVKGILN